MESIDASQNNDEIKTHDTQIMEWVDFAESLSSLDFYNEAIAKYEIALSLCDKYKDEYHRQSVLVKMGDCHHEFGRYDKAIEAYEQSYEFYGFDPESDLRFRIAASQKRLTISSVVKLDQDTSHRSTASFSTSWELLGMRFARVIDDTESFPYFEKIIANGDAKSAWVGFASASDEVENAAVAFIAHKKVLEIDPCNRRSLDRAASLSIKFKNFEDALDYAKCLTEIDDGAERGLQYQCMVHILTNDWAATKSCITRIKALPYFDQDALDQLEQLSNPA